AYIGGTQPGRGASKSRGRTGTDGRRRPLWLGGVHAQRLVPRRRRGHRAVGADRRVRAAGCRLGRDRVAPDRRSPPGPPPRPPPVAASGSATPTSPPHRILTLGTADSGGSFCVKQGTGVLIYLRGTPAAKWAALRSSSAAMVPRANGHLMLALGVTGGYFVAT